MHKHVTKRAFGGYRRSLGGDDLDFVNQSGRFGVPDKPATKKILQKIRRTFELLTGECRAPVPG